MNEACQGTTQCPGVSKNAVCLTPFDRCILNWHQVATEKVNVMDSRVQTFTNCRNRRFSRTVRFPSTRCQMPSARPLHADPNIDYFVPNDAKQIQNTMTVHAWNFLTLDVLFLDDITGEEDYPEETRSTHRRKRSSTQQEYNIEIMVVADRKMAEYHGAEFKSYVLMLMSIVALIYKDASIGNPINIAVVKLFVLQDVELAKRHYNEAGISAADMLRKFCAWQQKHNDPNDDSKNHHDSALLLTR
ncbi:A disintegrin and metalloproteinase with thrombospondin motifs 9 [Homalodisca vitripennis]|nr:A disintegrin and metalloproteinase with thrombospondin motifs 9 [Homalodisca vitripennis]